MLYKKRMERELLRAKGLLKEAEKPPEEVGTAARQLTLESGPSTTALGCLPARAWYWARTCSVPQGLRWETRGLTKGALATPDASFHAPPCQGATLSFH